MNIIPETILEDLLLTYFIPHLNPKDIGILCQISKLYKSIFDKKEIWKYYYLNLPPIPCLAFKIPAYKDLYWLCDSQLINLNKDIILNYNRDINHLNLKNLVLNKLKLRNHNTSLDAFRPSNIYGLKKHTFKELNKLKLI